MGSGKHKKTIVFSGINLFEGGPLSIYYDCLDAIKDLGIWKDNTVIAFVHKKELFLKYEGIVRIIELPKSRKNYINRIYYEYFYFNNFSKKRDIDIWISLHDMTPRVKARRLYTYCHNPTPFMKKDIRKVKYSLRNVLMSYFYKFLYRINIKSADGIIVQSDWMREAFLKLFPIKNVIVARPSVDIHFDESENICKKDRRPDNECKVFIYASFPRFFKNFEIICEACNEIDKKENFEYEVWLTIDGSENKYASDIYKKYNNNKHIRWLGIQRRDNLFEIYKQTDCMIFPSKLETWGLPISEYKLTGRDMLIVDLPYSHETLGSYDKVMFFGEDDYKCLAKEMVQVIQGTQQYQPQITKEVREPYAADWNELLTLIMQGG